MKKKILAIRNISMLNVPKNNEAQSYFLEEEAQSCRQSVEGDKAQQF